jgi:hypothetical protein
MQEIVFFFLLVLNSSFTSAKSCTDESGKFFINSTGTVGPHDKGTCPNGYHLAELNDPFEWERAITFTTQCLGFNSAAWISRGLGFRGEGGEDWMLVTPAHSNGNQPNEPLPDLLTFVSNRRGKLAINSNPNRKLVKLCAKNSSDQ